MADSLVEIYNMALTELGAELVTAPDDPRADRIHAVYPLVRDAVLRGYPFKCAKARAILAPLATTPAFDWSYQFQLPADCLKVRQVDDLDSEWTVEGKLLLYDGTAPQVVYTKRIDDVTQYDASLVLALSSRLAHHLAYKVLQSNSIKDSLWESYRTHGQEARSVDSQEGSVVVYQANDWTMQSTSGLMRPRNPV